MGLIENIAKSAATAAVGKAITGNKGGGNDLLGKVVGSVAGSSVGKAVAGQVAGQVVSKKLGGGVLGQVAGQMVAKQVSGGNYSGSNDVANGVINVVKMGAKALGK